MSEPYPDNDFLLRWLNGGLTEAERLEWEASEAYPRWEAMARSLKASALPPLDKDAAYARLLDARARRLQGSIRRLRVWRLAAAAAVVALILIGVGLYPREQSWAAAMAEQRSISLPDGSEAILNAATTLSYRNGWLRNSRKVKLDGEAFFSVTPGVPFTVRTGIGEVRVLGTQFNVLARGSRFEVACMEGSVLVRYGTQQDTLKPGQSLKKQGAQLEQQPEAKSLERPPWTHGESVFSQAPLQEVFQEMERQYGIAIRHPRLEGRLYSGRFPHDDINKALGLVCGAMGLEYTFVNKDTVQISE